VKHPRLITVLVSLLVAVVLLAAACGGDEEEPSPAPPPAQTETSQPPAPPPPATETEPVETEPAEETMALSVYFLRGEKIGVARRFVPETQGVGRAALEELLAGPTAEETEAGLLTGIPEGTELLGLTIENGVATVDLSGAYDDGGGSLAMFTRLAQVVYTLTQFPTVQGVNFELDGEPVETFSSEGIILDHPQTREDYEDQTAAIHVETPAIGDTVMSPLVFSGTANVFEATLNYQLLDAEGEVIAEDFVTATCGTGCRGTFEASVPFEYEGEPRGTFRAFELSAKDGSEINVVEIPVAFEPG
jgi:hypothetical protein